MNMRLNYSNLRTKLVRFFLICCVALTSTQLFAAGWTPTDGGLLVNLEQGERFLLSVWIDVDGDGVEDPGEEFFASNYTRYTGGYFKYTAGSYLKLMPQAIGVTKPSEQIIWTVGHPLDRGNIALDGTVYTMWNDGKTFKTQDYDNKASDYLFYGYLTDTYADKPAMLCLWCRRMKILVHLLTRVRP